MIENQNPTDTSKSLFDPDEPVENVSEDRFDHKYFVDALKYIILNCGAPLNIALYGKWGVGKSSILNFFDENIRHNKDLNTKFNFVIIDVWKFSPSILKQEFLYALNRKLDKSIQSERIEGKLWHYHEKESLTTPKISWSSKFMWMWIAFYAAIIVVPLVFAHHLDSIFGNAAVNTSSLVASMIPVFVVVISTLREISKSISKSGRTLIPRIESHAQFQDLFKEMIDRNNHKKLIIAVDNLDRCDNESVISILNMIKTFLSDPRCVFIVSCDQDAIIKHLQQNKGKFEKYDAKEFLTKFFQVSLHIPNQIKGQLYSYAKSQLEIFVSDINLDPNVADVFANAITKNPRKIRQFVYNFAIAYKMAAMKEDKGSIAKNTVTGNTAFLAKVTVLREEWPDFFSSLEKNPTLLDAVQEFIDAGRSSEYDSQPLETLLKNNKGLKHFLRSTSTTKSIQVLPFIQLNQESFESTLSELENMIVNVNQNNVESVKEILRKDSGKQKEYVLGLCHLAEQYIEYGRTMVANNTINVLISIYSAMENHSQKEIIKLLDKFMGGSGVLDNLMAFSIDSLFPITLLLDSNVKEAIHGKYAQNLSMPNYTNMIIEKFIDNIASISDPVCRISDDSLRLLGQKNKDLFYDAVTRLAKKDTTAEKFIRERTLNEVIDSIQPSTRDKWMDMYLNLRRIANENNKQTFVKKMLSAIKTDSLQDMPPENREIYGRLRGLASDDFTGGAAKYAYDSLKDPAVHYANFDEKAMISEIILKTYASLDRADREEFATNIFAPLITQAPQQISSIVEVIRKEGVQILEFEPVADAVFDLLQNNPTSELISLMYAGIPENKWADSEDRVIQMHDADAARVRIFSSAFGLSDRAPRRLRTRIFGQILQSCRQFSHSEKISIYNNLMETSDVLDSSSISTLADELLSELKPDDGVEIGICLELIGRCFDKATETKRREIISSLLTKLKEGLPSKADFIAKIMMFLVSKNKDMITDEKDWLASFVIEALANTDNPPVVIRKILSQFNNVEFGSKKELADELLGKLCESPNEDIKSKAQEIKKGL